MFAMQQHSANLQSQGIVIRTELVKTRCRTNSELDDHEAPKASAKLVPGATVKYSTNSNVITW